MRPQYEPIYPLEHSSFKAFITVKGEFDYPFHYHPEFELIYILSSAGLRFVGNHFDNFFENDLVMLGADLPHCWKNSTQCNGTAFALVIQWNKDLLGADWMERKEFTGIKRLHNLSAKGIKFSLEISRQLRPLLISLINEPSSFQKIIKLVNILQQLSFSEDYNLICEETYSGNFNISDNDRLNKIYQHLQAHYKEKITLTDMASLVCMTEVSFCRFFSKLMKKSFFSFLNEYRINLACKMLIETDMQIGHICDQSGFGSVSFFYRQFKRFRNCSPLYYSNKFKNAGGYPIPKAPYE